MFWEDLAPEAFFTHPSVLLLLDARSGRVRMRERLGWAPMVNGRRAVFLRSAAGYTSSRYRVYASPVAGAHGQRASASARRASSRARGPKASAALAPNPKLSELCFIVAGTADDPLFQGDATYITQMAARLHRPLAVAGTVPELQQAINDASGRGGCSHIVLFLDGHGLPPFDPTADGGLWNIIFTPGVLAPCIQLANLHTSISDGFSRVQFEVLCAGQLKGILAQHPGTKFDVQIDSCFGGRFLLPLTELPNVASVGSASGPKRVAFGDYGGPSPFIKAVVDQILSWANDPQFVKETGGNITGALEHGDQLYALGHLDREPEVYDAVHGEIVYYDPAHPNGQYVPSPAPPAHGVVPCPMGKGVGAAKFEIRIDSTPDGDDVFVSPPGKKLPHPRPGYTDKYRFCFGGPVTVTLKEVAGGSDRPGGWILESSDLAGRSRDRCRETGSNISLGDGATCTVVFTRKDLAWVKSHRYGYGVVEIQPIFKSN